jgi:hypothetical protein
MSALDFPSSPVNGQTFVDGPRTWTFNSFYGVWNITSEGIIGPTGYTGSQGVIGYTGSFGATGYTGSQGVIGYTGSFGATGYTGSSIGASTNTQIIFNDSGAANGSSNFIFNKTTNALDVTGSIRAAISANTGDSMLIASNINIGTNTTKYASLLFQGANTSGTIKSTGVVLLGPIDANYTSSYMAFQTRNSDAISERMRIDSSGNVGIGTSAPATKLEVSTNTGTEVLKITQTDATGGTIARMRLSHGSGTQAVFEVGSGYGALGLTTSGPLAFNTNNTERMRITAAGNLLVGVATTPGTPNARIVAGGTADAGIQLTSNNGGGALILSINGVAGAAFYTHTGAVGSEAYTERMRIDSSGNLGIGTTAPSAKLDVVAAAFTGGPLIGVRYNTSNYRMGFGIANSNGFPFIGLNVNNSADDNGTFDISSWASRLRMENGSFQFQTSSVSGTAGNAITWNTHAYITSAGNVGIGTASPGTKLEVSSTSAGATAEVLRLNNPGAGASTAAQIKFFAAGTNYASIAGGYGAAAAQMTFNMPTASAGNYVWQGNSVEQMRLDASGNLGIGTSAPVGRLTIQGAIGTSGINQGLGLLHWTGTQYGALGLNNSTGWPQLMARAGAGLTFHVNSDLLTTGEVMRLTSAGNVGIGTSSPGNKLHVVASTQVDADGLIRAENSATTGTINSSVMVKTYYGTSQFMQWENNGVRIGCRSTANGGAGHLVFTAGTDDEKMRLTAAGNLGIGTTTPGYKLEVNGSFAATTKSFVIDHPTKPDMKLRYGSLEGPENGVYVRGKLNGNNIIELPDYWTGLVDEDTITVNLTPFGKKQDLFVLDISNNQITVGSTDVNCFYTVFAERKDVEKIIVEFNNGN